MAKDGGHQQYPPTQAGNTWSSGLCGCFDDVGNCCTTLWCPCVTFGRVAEILDRGSSSCAASGALYALLYSLTGFHWIYSCSYRKKMREQYSLPVSPCDDCIVHWCCEFCALCQEYRELKNRGFDMSIGWQANVERMGGGGQNMQVPLPMNMGMNR